MRLSMLVLCSPLWLIEKFVRINGQPSVSVLQRVQLPPVQSMSHDDGRNFRLVRLKEYFVWGRVDEGRKRRRETVGDG